jgi:hypothetical protein
MTRPIFCFCLVAGLGWSVSVSAAGRHELITRETETGTIVGYKDTPLQPWTGDKYCVHDPDRPIPAYVDPGPAPAGAGAPSDATVLFDGTDLSHWKASSWKVEEGYVEAGEGSLETNEAWGDFQLHLEWRAPATPPDRMMNRGNSGVLLMGRYEIQIFDSHPMHAEQIYPDGQAASLYGQTPPLVNACRRPGEWQSFDVIFTAPVFEGDKPVERPKVTVLHNGVLVHLEQEIYGPMAHCQIRPLEPHADRLPLSLQGHGSPVRFRNIWIRPLPDLRSQ